MAEDDAVQELFARIVAFEWDEDKRERNLHDHQVDFDDARRVFDEPTFIRRSDRRAEIRYMVFGFLNGDETVVVCTLREQNCRLISARRARRDERKKYYGDLTRRSEPRQD
jgi:uncharacterized DUF497 family protein